MKIDKHMAHVWVKTIHVVFHTQNVNKRNCRHINRHHHHHHHQNRNVNGSDTGDNTVIDKNKKKDNR